MQKSTLQMEQIRMEVMNPLNFLSLTHLCIWNIGLLPFVAIIKCCTLVLSLQLNKDFDGCRMTLVISVFFFELLAY